jgi:hypothetical protein
LHSPSLSYANHIQPVGDSGGSAGKPHFGRLTPRQNIFLKKIEKSTYAQTNRASHLKAQLLYIRITRTVFTVMAEQDPLNSDVRSSHLAVTTKCAIFNAIWGSKYKPQALIDDVSLGASYLRYYEEQCSHALHSKSLNILIATHADVSDVIQKLKDPIKTREQIVNLLRAQLPDPDARESEDEVLEEIVNLAVRLWLMIDVGKLQLSSVPGQKPLLWEEGTLKGFIEEYFGSPTGSSPTRIVRVKLDRLFTARNLERIAGLQIVWTDNLSDHLRLTMDDTQIAIYHHATFLVHHKDNAVFPPRFIDETLRTLALLFPQYDKKSCKWFRAQQQKSGLDSQACGVAHLTAEERQIENFMFWHDRIGILKQVFDEAEPSTIAQWWRDRRRRVQWYTFWVAFVVLALTILFGLIQSIEGGFQVYKAYYPS